MCCAFLTLFLLGPRVFNAFWWLFRPLRWQAAFANWGGLWWLWPILGILFVPWTTMMFIIVSPGGVFGWEWMWVGLMFVFDVLSYTSGAARQRIPGYQGY